MTTSDPNTGATVDEEQKVLTRRQLLKTAAAGGAVIAVGALGGAAVGNTMTTAQYELELTKLRALVALYEQLERVGLDAIISTGMNIVRGALDAVKGGVSLLRDGVTAAENALKNFQMLLATLSGAANAVSQTLDDLSTKFHAAEGVVVAVLGTALPLADSITGFFNALLDKIPFGIGDDIHRAVNALIDLIRAIPGVIDAVTNRLLKPLQDAFFPASGDPSIQSNLIDPITHNVLEPVKKTLDDIDNLANHWETDLATPIQTALTERQKIRAQIAEYKQQNGIT